MSDKPERVERDRTSVSLPYDLAEFARAKGKGNTSAYLASLIERDRLLDDLRAMFVEHGYVGSKAITDEGVAAMRSRLNEVRARRAASRRRVA
jgi:hypothetical protein